jgi:hypothetical protein
LGGLRDTTNASYEAAWRNWCDWCVRREADPLSPSLLNILEFLTELFESGKASSTINVHKAMLSTTLKLINDVDIVNHPRVELLMRSIYNNRPPLPKYTNTWNVANVLSYVASCRSKRNVTVTTFDKEIISVVVRTHHETGAKFNNTNNPKSTKQENWKTKWKMKQTNTYMVGGRMG